MGICYVVGAGEFAEDAFCPDSEDYIIACDGGYAYCRKAGVQPQLVVGDFDSLGYRPDEENMVILKPEKDETDLAWGIEEGIARGYKEFAVFGGTGGRLSHTIANLRLMTGLAERGIRCTLYGSHSRIHVIRDGSLTLKGRKGTLVSVFACDRAEGVTYRGLKYPLVDKKLEFEDPLGVSNELLEEEAEISVAEGGLMIIEEF